jgi:hypothetical protein
MMTNLSSAESFFSSFSDIRTISRKSTNQLRLDLLSMKEIIENNEFPEIQEFSAPPGERD